MKIIGRFSEASHVVVSPSGFMYMERRVIDVIFVGSFAMITLTRHQKSSTHLAFRMVPHLILKKKIRHHMKLSNCLICLVSNPLSLEEWDSIYSTNVQVTNNHLQGHCNTHFLYYGQRIILTLDSCIPFVAIVAR